MGAVDTSVIIVDNYSEKDDNLLLLGGAHLSEGNTVIVFGGEKDLRNCTIAQTVLA